MMTESIAHRGPDGDGFWMENSGSVGLGHRRLKVIDLSEAGRQPMVYGQNERYVIVYNGEIYNYRELRSDLLQSGYAFVSQSDTEVILALYAQKKEDCVSYLNGMFAFAIYDRSTQTLFCARDRFGEKPFYYVYEAGIHFLFASEMKAIRAAGKEQIPNGHMLYNYLSYGLLHNVRDPSETFYKDIHSLEPGHYLKVNIKEGLFSKVRYWQLNRENSRTSSLEDQAARFKMSMEASVSLRLRSDMPVGSSLSGGLDSSLIIQLIRRCLGPGHGSIQAFSARFPHWALDEGKYIEMAAAHAGASVKECYPDGKKCWEELPDVFRHQEEPFGSAGIYAQYCVMRSAASEGVTVLLDGQGADELLGGYPHYYSKGIRYYLGRYMPGADRMIRAALNGWKRTLHPDFLASFGTGDYLPGPESRERFHGLKGALRYDLTRGNLQVLLRYCDRNAMAFGREVRLPFLDPGLVEFVCSLPEDALFMGDWTKYLMRKAYEGVLPRPILYRRDKVGFEPPQRQWMAEPGARDLYQAGLQRLVDGGIFVKSALHKPFEPNDAYLTGNGSWRIIMASMLF